MNPASYSARVRWDKILLTRASTSAGEPTPAVMWSCRIAPPAEWATASHDQAGKARTDDGAGDGDRSECHQHRCYPSPEPRPRTKRSRWRSRRPTFFVFCSPCQFQPMLGHLEHEGAVIAQRHAVGNLKAGGGLPSVRCSLASLVNHGSRAACGKCKREHHNGGKEGKDHPVHEQSLRL